MNIGSKGAFEGTDKKAYLNSSFNLSSSLSTYVIGLFWYGTRIGLVALIFGIAAHKAAAAGVPFQI